MKIDPNFVDPNNAAAPNVGNASNKPSFSTQSSKSAETDSSALDSGDTVEISGTLGEVQQLKLQLSQVPDVRASRVAVLQQQIQQGAYRPSSQAIADALMSNLLGPGNTK